MTTNSIFPGGFQNTSDLFGNGTSFSSVGRVAGTGTEGDTAYNMAQACTLQFLGCRITSNTSGANVTKWVIRIAGATGNQVDVLTSSVTGWIADTTHTDSVTAGQLINYAFVGTSGGPDTNFTQLGVTINAATPISGTFWHANSVTNGSAENLFNPTTFLPWGGGALTQAGGEASATSATQVVMRAAATYKNFCVHVTGGGSGSAAPQINGSAGNQTVNLATGGLLTDTTHTDSVAAGNNTNAKFSIGGSATNIGFFGTLRVGAISAQDVISGRTNQASSLTTSDAFIGISGTWGQASAETNAKLGLGYSCVASRARFQINSNTETNTTSFKVRKNGADGNQTVSVLTTVTGLAEDTTHTDSFVSGDDINYRFASNGGSGAIVLDWQAIVLDDGTAAGGASAAGLMSFAGIAFSANSNDPRLSTGLLHFTGITFVAGGTGHIVSGTGQLTFSGINLSGLSTTIAAQGAGVLSFAGTTFHAGGFIPTPAGTGLRQFWTT